MREKELAIRTEDRQRKMFAKGIDIMNAEIEVNRRWWWRWCKKATVGNFCCTIDNIVVCVAWNYICLHKYSQHSSRNKRTLFFNQSNLNFAGKKFLHHIRRFDLIVSLISLALLRIELFLLGYDQIHHHHHHFKKCSSFIL